MSVKNTTLTFKEYEEKLNAKLKEMMNKFDPCCGEFDEEVYNLREEIKELKAEIARLKGETNG